MTEQPIHQEQQTLAQRIADSHRATLLRVDVVRLSIAVTATATSLAANVVSFVKGYDVLYQPGVRRMATPYGVGKAGLMALQLASASLGSVQLAQQRQHRELYGRSIDGLKRDTPAELAQLMLTSFVFAAEAGHTLATGRTAFKKLPLSTCGRVMAGARTVQYAFLSARAGRHLYIRRAEWSPELQTYLELGKQNLADRAENLTIRAHDRLVQLGICQSDAEAIEDAVRRAWMSLLGRSK